MTVLKVIAVLLLVLFLVGLVRAGGGGEYSAEGFRAWVKLGPLRIRVFPAKEKKAKKPPGKKKEKPKEPGEPPIGKMGGPVELVKRYLPLACEAAGELKRRIRVDELYLDYTAAGKEDAAAAAMGFGYSNAAAGIILPLLEQNFEVKTYRVRTAVDFTAGSPKIYLYAAVSARIGQLVGFGLRFGWKFLRITLAAKNAKKEASQDGR